MIGYSKCQERLEKPTLVLEWSRIERNGKRSNSIYGLPDHTLGRGLDLFKSCTFHFRTVLSTGVRDTKVKIQIIRILVKNANLLFHAKLNLEPSLSFEIFIIRYQLIDFR